MLAAPLLLPLFLIGTDIPYDKCYDDIVRKRGSDEVIFFLEKKTVVVRSFVVFPSFVLFFCWSMISSFFFLFKKSAKEEEMIFSCVRERQRERERG